MNRRCDQCEWWSRGSDEGSPIGDCFRYPVVTWCNEVGQCGEFTHKGEPLPVTKALESKVEWLSVRLTKLEIAKSQEDYGKGE